MSEHNYYLIRVGEGSKYIDEAHKNGFVAIGWNEVPDLRKFSSLEQIKKSLENSTYQYSKSQIAAQAGQLTRFGHEIKNDDILLSPLGNGEYLVGIVGDYYYDENPHGLCNYKHRRKIKWMGKTLSKEDMSTNLAYAVGAIMTIFSLNKYSRELEMLIAGQTYTPAEKPQRIRDIVLENLMDLDGKEFEMFISHVLEIIGFSAETTQYSGDKGIDVNGTLDAEGVANITLRVQVKRKSSSIGNKDILAIRGALSQGEHGCLITLSTFTKQAVEEAQAPGKVLIKLIDGNDLAGLILKHFDDIDDYYKKKFGIRRKKDFNIDDQFEAIDQTEVEPFPEISEEKIEKPEWDTLLCAAQEDGFKRVFLMEHAWYAVRINRKAIPFIKYLAMYQVAPVSKITYYGEVERIEPFEDTGKYKIFLKGNPIELENPVGLGINPHLKPQGPRYTTLTKILKAKTLDDVF